MATVELQNLRELIKAIIKAELSVNNKAYPDILIDDSINSIYQDIVNGTLIDPNTGETVTKTNITFLEADAFYTTVQTSQISVLAVVWATTLDLDTTDFLSTGAVWVEWNIITYTWKTATQLTGCSWIAFAHITGMQVRQLFTLPADYNYATRLTYDYKADLLPYDYREFIEKYNGRYYNSLLVWAYKWNNDVLKADFFYAILRDTYILPITTDTSWKSLQLMYQKWVTDLSADTDICQIPDKYCKRVIKYIGASNVVADRWELDVSWLWYTRWIKEVKKMYKVESSKARELQFNNRVRTGADNILNI